MMVTTGSRESIRLLHYYFTHNYLHKLAKGNAKELITRLFQPSGTAYVNFLWDTCASILRIEPSAFSFAEGLKSFPIKIGDKHIGAIIQLPRPEKVTEAYFVAIILPVTADNSTAADFYTLELAENAMNGTRTTVLGKWTDQRHLKLGFGIEPEINRFLNHLQKLY